MNLGVLPPYLIAAVSRNAPIEKSGCRKALVVFSPLMLPKQSCIQRKHAVFGTVVLRLDNYRQI